MIFKKIGNMENVEVICHYYLSQPKQPMANSKIGFLWHFSPKSLFRRFQALEIQASMRSIVIPADKLLE